MGELGKTALDEKKLTLILKVFEFIPNFQRKLKKLNLSQLSSHNTKNDAVASHRQQIFN